MFLMWFDWAMKPATAAITEGVTPAVVTAHFSYIKAYGWI